MVEKRTAVTEDNEHKGSLTLGMVIPCFNEADVLPMLFDDLNSFAESLPNTIETKFLLIDDGSTDESYALIKEQCSNDKRYACLKFSRNFGHQTAVSAGIDHVEGDVVAVIDADLQDPPHVITQMLKKWEEGYDVVYGIRKNRKESALLRGAYSIFYRLLKRIANVDIPLDAGDFSIMDRKVVDTIRQMPEHNRFIRGLRGWVGFRQTGLEYERMPRAAGTPKYNVKKLFRLAFDGIVTLSSFPLKIASWIGATSAIFGVCYGIYAVIDSFLFGRPPSGWPSLAMLIIFFGGVQLMVLGIIGEYIGRIFDETKHRPLYISDRVNGWLKKSDR